MWTCEKCGLTITKRVVLPVHHLCDGQYLQPQPVCIHRGPRIGNASCGCGAVYECQLLNIFCGDKQPLEFADFQGTILDETNFRCCRGCPTFSTQPTLHP
jgi:hypothetical protein